MSINLLRQALIFIFFSTVSHGSAQNLYQLGTLPTINVNKKFDKDWALNFKWESRQSFRRGTFGKESTSGLEYILSDLSLIASKKVGLNNSLAAGYLVRILDDRVVHRTIQQFTIVDKYGRVRVAYRFAADQTFIPNAANEYRLRFRLGALFPLNGDTVDPKEFYFKLNHEYLNSLESDIYDLEIRALPLLGYEFTDNNKVEIGLDYRFNSFINPILVHRFWFSLNWYLVL